jgi:hypothetical protein
MAEKKKFLLRISENLFAALEKWAADDLRSVNAEVEYLLTEAVRKAGRLKSPADGGDDRGSGDDGATKGGD